MRSLILNNIEKLFAILCFISFETTTEKFNTWVISFWLQYSAEVFKSKAQESQISWKSLDSAPLINLISLYCSWSSFGFSRVPNFSIVIAEKPKEKMVLRFSFAATAFFDFLYILPSQMLIKNDDIIFPALWHGNTHDKSLSVHNEEENNNGWKHDSTMTRQDHRIPA